MGLTTDAHQEVPDVDGVGLLPHAVDPILAKGGRALSHMERGRPIVVMIFIRKCAHGILRI